MCILNTALNSYAYSFCTENTAIHVVYEKIYSASVVLKYNARGDQEKMSK